MAARKQSSTREQAGYAPDYWLLSSVLAMSALGLVMVLSASGVMAERFWQDRFFFFKKQLLFAGAGLVLMALTARLPRKIFYKLVYLWLVLGFGLLAMTLSSLGIEAGGARRWLSLGGVSFQALEMVKVALVFYLAYFFSQKQHLVKTFSVGFVPPVLITAGLSLLLLLQPDFGGAVFLAALLFMVCLVAGTRFIYLFTSLALASGTAVLLVLQSPYRFRRWFAFLDPFKDALDSGYQLVQSFYALGSGGLFGVGLGAGKQKLFFLPDAHNDFILAVLGEELGFAGTSFCFLCIGVVIWRSFRISTAQPDMQDRLTAYGLSLILIMGMLMNAAVVLGAVPPKGVPMPFVSYGGSQLLSAFFCVGMLLNLSRQVK
ncbi:MAG: putative lipid II flippase FtsW [Desulfovibrionales bacterium]